MPAEAQIEGHHLAVEISKRHLSAQMAASVGSWWGILTPFQPVMGSNHLDLLKPLRWDQRLVGQWSNSHLYLITHLR